MLWRTGLGCKQVLNTANNINKLSFKSQFKKSEQVDDILTVYAVRPVKIASMRSYLAPALRIYSVLTFALAAIWKAV